jgi:hypothetical protein
MALQSGPRFIRPSAAMPPIKVWPSGRVLVNQGMACLPVPQRAAIGLIFL